jgi:hypothetical protein
MVFRNLYTFRLGFELCGCEEHPGSTSALGGLKIGASVAYENAFEVSCCGAGSHLFLHLPSNSHDRNKIKTVGNSLKILFLFLKF